MSAPTATETVSAPTQRDITVADAGSSESRKSQPSKSQSLEQFAKQTATGKTPQKAAPKNQSQTESVETPDDDPEFDFDGEKYKKSQLAELAKKRREYDRAAAQRFEEAAKIRKAAEAREAQLTSALEQFKTNPWALFEQAGIDPNEVAEQRLAAQLKRQQMSPEAIELEKAQSELARLQKEAADFKETQQKQAHEQRVKHWLGYFDKAIGTALETGGIPRTARTAQRVRQSFEDLVDAGHKIDDATGSLAVDLARDSMVTETQQLLGEVAKTSPKMLVELMGGLDSEIVKAIQRMAVERHESSAQPKPKAHKQPTQLQPKPKEIPTLEDIRKRLGSL